MKRFIVLIRLLHVILSISLFVGSAGLLIQKHYCQNQLQGISFFFKAESCHAGKTQSCHSSKKKCCQISQDQGGDNCCQNYSEYIKLDLDQNITVFLLKDFTYKFFPALPFQKANLYQAIFPNRIKFLKLKPPLINLDFQSFFQVFLC